MISSKQWLGLGLTLAAFIVGGWKAVIPTFGSASSGASSSLTQLLGDTTKATYAGANAALATYHEGTGTYLGAPAMPGVTLVRADPASYCIQTATGHENGPGGTPVAGPC
ncbi:MAG: hypothetical protein ACR2MU_03980 [Gaiellaceae bacterium]